MAPLEACLLSMLKALGWIPVSPKAGHGGTFYSSRTQELEAVGTEVKGHPSLHTKFETRLGYKQLVLTNGTF